MAGAVTEGDPYRPRPDLDLEEESRRRDFAELLAFSSREAEEVLLHWIVRICTHGGKVPRFRTSLPDYYIDLWRVGRSMGD